MTKSELQEQIEAWLNHTMDPETLQAWEQRMADEPALRQEIALHQQVQADFDAGRLHLRANLINILNEALPSETASKPGQRSPWLPGLLLLSIVLVTSWVIWQWGRPTHATAPAAPAPPPLASPVPDTALVAPTQEKPVAMLDLARFKTNPSMEAMVNSKVRSESVSVKMSRPTNGVQLTLNKRGKATLRFTGILQMQSDPVPPELVLSFFDNINTSTPVLEASVSVEKEGNIGLKFDFQQGLNLQPGLYYFTLETRDAGEVLYAGKFSIVPR